MTYIPNAREGEQGYKDTDLKGDKAYYLKGYDAAIEDILDLESNLDCYSDKSLVAHYLIENEDKAKELFEIIADWAEMDRNQTAVALLDTQAGEEAEKIKDLYRTINFMISEDYKERFIAEYAQLVIRSRKLKNVIEDYNNGKLKFELNCPIDLLESQYKAMVAYCGFLVKRAEIENIELPEVGV